MTFYPFRTDSSTDVHILHTQELYFPDTRGKIENTRKCTLKLEIVGEFGGATERCLLVL